MKNLQYSIRESSENAQVGDFISIVENPVSKRHDRGQYFKNAFIGHNIIGQIIDIPSDRKRFIVKLVDDNCVVNTQLDEIVVPEFSFCLIYRNDLGISLGDYIRYNVNGKIVVCQITRIFFYDFITINTETSTGQSYRISLKQFDLIKKISKEEFDNENTLLMQYLSPKNILLINIYLIGLKC
jgi:hypothetical protein